MSTPELLAIVEVPRDERVRCQAAGCNHAVFRRIHVVRKGEAVSVLGSQCFKRLFATLPVASAAPKYGSSEGRHLSDEERQLLIENTKRLIEQFEAEYQVERARAALLDAQRRQATPVQPPARHEVPRPPPQPDAEAKHVSEVQAKEAVRRKYGVDPELPGWRGLVLAEMRALLGKNAGSQETPSK